MTGHITALYAGLSALLLLALKINVIRMRWRYRVGLGDGNEPALARAVRMHGNFIENVPVALIVMLLVESAGCAAWLVHLMGAALVFGRVAHAWGLAGTDGPSLGRTAGVGLTTLVLLFGGLIAIYSFLAH
ncbi:MAG: MAPEG family protein [Alphaproteobacteria bacterium]|nr:MAPEG family protein [Alphaproteobacteria bacterium]